MDDLSRLNPVFNNDFKNGYAVLLPAITHSYHGKQENLQFLGDKAAFHYKWGLVSAGQFLNANLKPKSDPMIDDRDRNSTFILADSGGFQVAKGTWDYDVRKATAKQREELCQKVINWQVDHIGANVAVTLDIPTETIKATKGVNVGVTFQDCLDATLRNHETWERLLKRKPNDALFLNVMQGDKHNEREEWYEAVKNVSYTKGWAISLRAFGADNKGESLFGEILYFISWLKRDNLLKDCKHLHFLGETSLRTGMALTIIMRRLQKYSPGLMVTFDSSTPFVDGLRFGKVYHTWGFGSSKQTQDIEDDVENLSSGESEHYTSDIKVRSDVSAWIDKLQLGSIKQIPKGLPFWTVTSPVTRHLKVGDIQGGKGKYGFSQVGSAIIAVHNLYVWLLANLQMNRLLDHYLANNTLYDLPIEYDQFSKAVDKVLKAQNPDKVIYEQSSSKLLHFMNQTMVNEQEYAVRIEKFNGKKAILEEMAKINSEAGRNARKALQRQGAIVNDETECYDFDTWSNDDA
ncbi:MAG: hypothetical protein RJS98_11000 [Rhodospirillaceae bacterium]